MAKNSKGGSGDGLAWLILILCLGFVGFTVFRTYPSTSKTPGSDAPLQWNDHGDSSSDDLFAPATTAPPTQATEESTVPATDAESTEGSTAEGEGATEGSAAPTEDSGQTSPPTDPLLILVNRENPAPQEKPELTYLKEYGCNAATAAADSLSAMLTEGKLLGLRFVVCSSYRSTELQHKLFEEDLNARMAQGMSYEEAWEATAAYTMPPGCSEHCTGLAFDIVSYYHQQLDDSQESTAETRWLQTHCWEYGFILRYPKDKTSITGIAYESWHYRYVGKEAAKYMTENNLTLEEYHAQLG